MEKKGYILVSLLSVVVGLYPLIYFFREWNFGLLTSKDAQLLESLSWLIGFYAHIVFAGIALLIGWTQFSTSLRENKPHIHRLIGKTYVACAIVSSFAGLFIAFNATGGIIASLGFVLLGLIWLYSTVTAYRHIRSGDISNHQRMMVYSFAACFAAVTLRLWLPVLMATFGDFITAYRIVAWLCWVPNLLVAYVITSRIQSSS